MIDPQEIQELYEDLRDVSGWDVDVLLSGLVYLELKKLNFNLSQIDFSLRGLVYK